MVAESHQKCCYESCPERIAAEAHQNIAVKAVQNKILLRKLPREKTWDDSWQNQSSQDSRWNQRLLKLLSREILMKHKSRHQKDLMTFEYKIILTLYLKKTNKTNSIINES